MTAQQHFRQTLVTLAGQALSAAGYTLQENSVQWSSGLFRFSCPASAGSLFFVDYQLLVHEAWPSRFSIMLSRELLPETSAELGLERARISLPRLLWDVFDLHLLSQPDHWWMFDDERQLADGLLEASKLLFGYGLPWLDGSLAPGQDTSG